MFQHIGVFFAAAVMLAAGGMMICLGLGLLFARCQAT